MNIKGEKKVLIADDHAVVCRGIEVLVRPAFEKATFSYANSIQQVLEAIEQNQYDVLLLDVNYADANLTQKISEIRAKSAQAKIVVFTSGLSFKEFNILKKEVNAILTKQSEASAFIHTLETVFNTGGFVSSPLNEEKVKRLETLTERELDILECMLSGMGNKEMVYHLDIKESTISTLRKRILGKLDLTNNVELLNYFTENIL
ncbi:DNA-binding response regulator [Flavobacterium columnare NBRC 100251 = ATCC 23463]|uniref:DNA-binding response regulator, LuxR family protein n=1 Tax=Flavobacterium columnare (strain ATCC 49512 / CIP 103533 / TG 44/87) TaxID=1041826 RepID=G8X5N8_FLACA|nr:response regulator transcription factor [Flavobacterium columnare]AEW86882.1 DNA-binding response regulator, LuxR family protein [Flavobacterium columnare ATCC 49512]ANO47809.1 DNA-binding response regulator, LuxR family protein [Flavobacterium columnare]APT21591.1 DNA-binding response regulator [Flavobacterium columnare]MBF6652230.1 DNA-binding response regulator [Flavobacterium columnare]MBF6655065.1 DNA-binding response regulator [Flavobacterium columnare]